MKNKKLLKEKIDNEFKNMIYISKILNKELFIHYFIKLLI